jgi:hypothetical protein
MSLDGQSAVAPAGGEWWHKPFSVFQTNLQDIDATMDVDSTLDVIEAYGADTWLINVGGIFSFFPTELSFQTRNPVLDDRPSGDLISDAVAAARQRGVRVLARCDFSKVSSTIAAAHPDWLFVSPDGEPQVYNGLYSTCPSGAYYQERSLDVINEILERYEVSGFFFNWFKFPEVDYARVYHGVCHCAACRDGFNRYAGGADLPDGPSHPNYALWRRFCGDVIEKLNLKIAAYIGSIRPGVGLVLKRGAPILYYEANNSFGRDFWPHATSEAVSAHVTGWPDVPVMVNCVSFVDMPYRMAGEQPEHFAQYQLQAMARGGNLSSYIMGAPGRIHYPSLALGGEINRFYRRHYHVYHDLKPAATIGIVRADPLGMSASAASDAVEEFRGIFTALREHGLPFDVLDATALERKSAAALNRYKVIVLPDMGAIGRPLAALLDAFVLGGGHVFLSGSSGVTAQGEIEMRTAPALMRNGAPLIGQDLWSSYIAPNVDSAPADFTYTDGFVPVFGAFSRYVWKTKAERSGAFIPQAPFGPPEKCYGHEATAFPGKAQLRTNGSVIQIPWSIGRTYREFGTSEIREHLIAALEPLATPLVRAELQGAAEVIVGSSGSRLIVHIINQSGEKRRSFGPHMPLQDGALVVNRAVKGATALVASTPLRVEGDAGSGIRIALPAIELFEVIQIDLAF